MILRDRPSPNQEPRARGTRVDILLLHYTGMRTGAEAIDRLCDPAAKVSAHYVIEEDGTIWRLVDEARRAWHAGVASWQGTTAVNDASIGIELVNPGHEWGYRPFPEAQMRALEDLAHGILARHPIPGDRVVGHSDVAPLRKQDPGELFDWRRLSRAGIGLWPATPSTPPRSLAEAPAALAEIGYAVGLAGSRETHAAIIAFQRHYRPSTCDGALDDETRSRLAAVVAAVHALRRAR